MGICTDNALTYLNEIGYNVVRVPRRGINPLDVLGRDGKSLERLGKLSQIWRSSEAVPEERPPEFASAVTGQKTNEMSTSVGLKLLYGILGSLGSAAPKLDFVFADAESIQFTFGDVTYRGVDPFAVGSYLGHGDLSGDGPIFERYFENDEAQTYVITEVLESTSISVEAKDKKSGRIDMQIPVIKQAIGANLSVSSASESSGGVTFSGTVPVVFGFKVFNIAFDGKWRMSGAAPGPGLAFGAGAQPVLISNPGMLNA
ncbi:hypothetical protein [Rhizobium indigoferae]|uniref:Gasdermin bGSDM n=1 Tax=Rhizobium indigoferae TaxID=158891 RepID=A0ABZ0ZDN9_9HYPH|nr:hypothetical protein [Rhizobium indigoferae]NNU56130.1 hypothetical protein [Rhizobium indigoferae]WQN37749.1 hypothetical protein U5G49_002888 [Rhizobium indigoferae]GLR59347.1 hypothetical protein GCM10007919_40740 [Rhizobium indigoferae]